MRARTVSNGLFAALLLMGVGFPGHANGQTKTLVTAFEVTINERANPVDEPFSVIGTLTMNVEAGGGFTGHITPAADIQGHLLPGVLFHGKHPTLDINGPTSLKVSGQVNGRALALVIELPNRKLIFGTGASKDDLSKLSSGPIPGMIGGSAVTSDPGEKGDWIGGKIVIETVPCPPGCTSVLGFSCVVCVKVTIELSL